jgi:hypothetical protein
LIVCVISALTTLFTARWGTFKAHELAALREKMAKKSP